MGKAPHPAFADERVQLLIDAYWNGPVEHRPSFRQLFNQINAHLTAMNATQLPRTTLQSRLTVWRHQRGHHTITAHNTGAPVAQVCVLAYNVCSVTCVRV